MFVGSGSVVGLHIVPVAGVHKRHPLCRQGALYKCWTLIHHSTKEVDRNFLGEKKHSHILKKSIYKAVIDLREP